MFRVQSFVFVVLLACFVFECGEEYYATPEKTLNMYVENRMMGSRQEIEACLNSFRKEDKTWYLNHYEDLCHAAYGRDCPGPGSSTEATVWTDMFEPKGPHTATVDSSNVDAKAGTATLTVAGQEIHFVKERGNWKIQGLFGIDDVKSTYPQIQ